MPHSKVVTLFGRRVEGAVRPSVDRDLFGSLQEVRGKVVFLDESDWNEESLLQVMTRNPIAAVVDMRSRPVFRMPNYRHRHIVSYLHRHGIQYLELINVLRKNSEGERNIYLELSGIVFGRAEHGLTIFFYDATAKERGWLGSIRTLMKSGANRFVELHPRALAGSGDADRSRC